MTETPTETFITFLRPKHPFITIKSEMREALTHEIIGRQFTLPHIVSGNIGNILKTTLIVLCQRHYAMTLEYTHIIGRLKLAYDRIGMEIGRASCRERV